MDDLIIFFAEVSVFGAVLCLGGFITEQLLPWLRKGRP